MFSLTITAAAVSYVFMALGMYAIARQRGINNPWLAWVPVARGWLLGCISDQYRYVNGGHPTKHRIVLVVLPVTELFLTMAAVFLGVFTMAFEAQSGDPLNTAAWVMGGLLVLVWVICLIVETVAAYDLHRSCDPGNAKLLLVLGMFIPCFRAVAVYLNRGKELGMPPRRFSAR